MSSPSLLMMLRSMLHLVMDWKQWPSSSFVCVARGWGLTVSLIKSKGMVAGIGADTLVLAPILVEGGVMELVESFQYLGSIIGSDGDLYEELSGRLAKAAKMFGCLETWAVKADQMGRLEAHTHTHTHACTHTHTYAHTQIYITYLLLLSISSHCLVVIGWILVRIKHNQLVCSNQVKTTPTSFAAQHEHKILTLKTTGDHLK